MINKEIVENRLNVQLLPSQFDWLEQMYNQQCAIISSDRQTGRSYTLAIFTAIKLLMPFEKNRIIITAPCFRNSKEIYENTLDFLNKTLTSPIGYARDSDKCTITVGQNTATFMPVGNGDKIRGLRGNILLIDNFDYIDKEAIENVILGMAAISSNPIERIKKKALGLPVFPEHQIIQVTQC